MDHPLRTPGHHRTNQVPHLVATESEALHKRPAIASVKPEIISHEFHQLKYYVAVVEEKAFRFCRLSSPGFRG